MVKTVTLDPHDDAAVLYRKDGDVARITINRPRVRNALNRSVVEGLCATLRRSIEDRVRVAVIAGAGSTFCAGHDLNESFIEEPRGVDRYYHVQAVNDISRLIRRCAHPVVASVAGYALGAGCEIALGCDVVIAEETAEFGFPEISVGLSLTGGGSKIIHGAVGAIAAKRLILLGDRFDAPTARRLNLVTLVAPTGELETETERVVDRLRSLSPVALTHAKRAIDRAADLTYESAYETEVDTALLLEGNADSESAAREFLDRRSNSSADKAEIR